MGDTQKLDKYFYGTGDGTSPELIEAGIVTYVPVQCNRDHCTPEERAVIKASLARREAEKAMFPFSTAPSLSFRQDSDEGHVLLSAFTAEQHACDALLAARAGRDLKWTGVGDETQ